ncbi:hypothetical protein HDV00_009458, partial [Rhizophlyctis rosea]
METFDVVVADEIETILYAFKGNASTVGDIGLNWVTLKDIINDASKVFMMDPLTTMTTINFAKGIVGDDQLEVFKTTTPPTPRHLRLIKSRSPDGADASFDTWLTMTYQALQRGEKLYVFTPYAKEDKGVDGIARLLMIAMGWTEGVEMLTYYAKKEKEKPRLLNANEIWGDPTVRVVVTNSAVSVGVNFDLKDVFDQIYCHYSLMLHSCDFLQALFRVRHPKRMDMIMVQTSFEDNEAEEEGKFERPVWSIWDQLQKDLEIEELSKLNNKRLQTLKLFCKMANITMCAADTSIVAKENKSHLNALAKDVESTFHFSKIELIDRSTYKKHLKLIFGNRGTVQMRLEAEKFAFRDRFAKASPEISLSAIWNKTPHLIYKVRKIVFSKEPTKHITYRILNENGVVFSDFHRTSNTDTFRSDEIKLESGANMTTTIPFDEIRQSVRFDGRIQDYNKGVVMKVLNGFLEMPLIKPAK